MVVMYFNTLIDVNDRRPDLNCTPVLGLLLTASQRLSLPMIRASGVLVRSDTDAAALCTTCCSATVRTELRGLG